MAEIASAFISLIPSLAGAKGVIQKEVDGEMTAAGKSGGKRFGGAFGSTLKAAIGPALAVVGTAAVGGLLKGAVAEASDLSESINAVQVSYGKAAKGVLALGKNSATSFGLSKSEFNGFAVQFQSFSKTIAGSNGDVAGSFKSIIGRATDFASVMNLQVGDAAELFQSGLAGETEPLRKYGIDLSAASVEAFALSSGIVKNKKDLTEAGKVQARYGLLMKKTSKFQGDFKNTSGGLANQQKILASRFTNLKATIGTALLPAATALVSTFNNRLIPAFRALAGFVRSNQTTLKVLGITIGTLLLPYLIASTVAFIANAASVLTTSAAWLAYGLVVKATAIATKAFTIGQWLLNAAMSANPIGLVVIALVALVAGLVFAYKKSETFRAIVDGAFNAIKAVTKVVFGFIAAYIKTQIAIAKAVLTGIWSAISAVIGFFGKLKSGVTSTISSVISTVRGIPGRIRSAVGNLGNLLRNAGKNLINGLINGIKSKFGAVKGTLGDLTRSLTSWKGPKSLDKIILKQSGQYVIDGFITGLESRYGDAQSSLGDLTGSLRSSVRSPQLSSSLGASAAAAPSSASSADLLDALNAMTLNVTVGASSRTKAEWVTTGTLAAARLS